MEEEVYQNKKPEDSKDAITHKLPLTVIALCLIVSIAAGIASGWWFSNKNTGVHVVDVKQILEDKKKEILEKYKQDPTDKNAEKLNNEMAEFLRRLDWQLSNYDQGILLVKDAVIAGEKKDVTERIKAYVEKGALLGKQ